MMLDQEPTLETTRLLLRPMREDDLGALLLIFTDPHVIAAFDAPPFDRSQMARWLGRNLGHQARYGYGLFALIHKSSRTLIGDCGLEVMTVEGREIVELGYDLRSDFWKRGYATEAATAVRDYAFSGLRLPELVSLIKVGNEASRGVAEAIGMRLTNTITRYGRQYWSYAITNPGGLA